MRQLPFWLLTLSLFSFLVLSYLLSDGMYIDGVTYSAIARNLALGNGTFWHPHYTDTLYSDFYEQPPLVFGIQSVFYAVFGDHLIIDRLFALSTAIITGWLIVAIWREIAEPKTAAATTWLPVLLWGLIPVCFWSYRSAMLENVVGIFALAAVYVLLKALHSGRARVDKVILAAILIFLGGLSKGLVALFPVAVPLLFWLIHRKVRFTRATSYSLLLAGVPLLLLFLVLKDGDAQANLGRYFQSHVVQGVSGQRDAAVGHRFRILIQLFEELLPPLLLALGLMVVAIRKKRGLEKSLSGTWTTSSFFLLLGFLASVPIMISLKQSRYYLVPSLPYFAIGLAVLVAPGVATLVNRIDPGSGRFRAAVIATSLLLTSGLVYSFLQIGRCGRDRDTLTIVHEIGSIVPRHATISTSPSIFREWSLHAYLARHYDISLDDSDTRREYALVRQESGTRSWMEEYVLVGAPGDGHLGLYRVDVVER